MSIVVPFFIAALTGSSSKPDVFYHVNQFHGSTAISVGCRNELQFALRVKKVWRKIKKHEAKLPCFNVGNEDDYHLRSVCGKTALRTSYPVPSLRAGNTYELKNDRALSTIKAAPGDKPLRAVQDCETAKGIWEKLETLLAGKTIVNKLKTFNLLLHTEVKSLAGLVGHI